MHSWETIITVKANWGELRQIGRVLGPNGSIYDEFDTFTRNWDNFVASVDVLRQFEAHRVELR